MDFVTNWDSEGPPFGAHLEGLEATGKENFWPIRGNSDSGVLHATPVSSALFPGSTPTLSNSQKAEVLFIHPHLCYPCSHDPHPPSLPTSLFSLPHLSPPRLTLLRVMTCFTLIKYLLSLSLGLSVPLCLYLCLCCCCSLCVSHCCCSNLC